jgi:enolase
MAFARAAGSIKITKKCSVPLPFMNVLNGGAHAGNDLAIQEFMIVPIKFPTFREALQAGAEIYMELKKAIKEKHGKNATNVGDEGGFAPPLANTRDALDLLVESIDKTGYKKEVKIALDAAASQFFNGNYHIDGNYLTPKQMLDYYINLSKSYPIISIEDPFDEEDFGSFAALKKKAKRFMIVADDLTTTNPDRIKTAIEAGSADALLVKINQIGTVTEALESIKLVRQDDWKIIISHRSGDTEDSFIADFAVGTGAFGAKFGAPCRSERVAKYNQLLRLEETGIKFIGRNFKLP